MPSRCCSFKGVYRFSEESQSLVRTPLGDVYIDETFGELISRIKDIWSRGLYVASVGDRVTYSLLKFGVIPDIAVIDGQEKRGDAPSIDISVFNKVFHGVNRKGTINMDLCCLIKEALSYRPSLIIIDGEEDLVGFPVTLALPVGSAFIYGQPGIGAVFVEITDVIKRHAKSILKGLEPI